MTIGKSLRLGGRGVVGLALVVLLGVGACVTDDRYLPALLEDPMAHLELPGTELIQRSETKQGEGFAQSFQAEVFQIFRVADPVESDAVLSDAVAYAESVGWVFDEPSPSGVYIGHKELEEGRARLSLSVSDRTGEVNLVARIIYSELYFP